MRTSESPRRCFPPSPPLFLRLVLGFSHGEGSEQLSQKRFFWPKKSSAANAASTTHPSKRVGSRARSGPPAKRSTDKPFAENRPTERSERVAAPSNKLQFICIRKKRSNYSHWGLLRSRSQPLATSLPVSTSVKPTKPSPRLRRHGIESRGRKNKLSSANIGSFPYRDFGGTEIVTESVVARVSTAFAFHCRWFSNFIVL